MAVVGALEAIKTGSTTVVENVGGIARTADRAGQDRPALGVRRVGHRPRGRLADDARDPGQGRGAALLGEDARRRPAAHQPTCTPPGTARLNGRISVFPAAGLAENSSPELLRAVQRVRREARPRLHHPPVAEPRRSRLHAEAPRHEPGGVPGQARLPRPAAVRRALPLRRRRRHRAARQEPAPSSRTRPAWPPTAASPRRSRRCAPPAAPSPTAPTTTPPTCSR